MFTRVARRYDVGNAVMTLGLSRLWRREIVRRAAPRPVDVVLDLATGTGQLARDLLRAQPQARVIGADLTPAMLERAKGRPGGDAIDWVCMDAHALALPDASVDVITHGYLLRYLRLEEGLGEQLRALAPGGRMVALETAPGSPGIIGRTAAAVTGFWPRLVSRAIGQEPADYEYLERSSLGFRQPEEMLALMRRVGFIDCGYRRYLAGMLCVYWGIKPDRPVPLLTEDRLS